jgi:hypothetical protein
MIPADTCRAHGRKCMDLDLKLMREFVEQSRALLGRLATRLAAKRCRAPSL